MAELRRDYDCLIKALEAAKTRLGTASQASDVRQELLDRPGPESGEGSCEENLE